MNPTREYLEWIYPDPSAVLIAYAPPIGTTYPAWHPLKEKPCNYWGQTWHDLDAATKAIEACERHGARAVWASVHRPRNSGSSRRTWAKWNNSEMARYQFLALDFDNVLPFGVTRACATDKEVERIGQHVEDVKRDLLDRGLPDPLHVATGNGHLLLFPVQLWATDDPFGEGRTAAQNHELLGRLATALSLAFDRPFSTLDTGVLTDPSRVLGVVGTMNRNKPEFPELGRVARRREVVGNYPDREPMTEAEFVQWSERYSAEAEQLHGTQIVAVPRGDAGAYPVVPADQLPAVVARARAYASKWPVAVEGHGGDLRTFQLAGHVLSFGLNNEDAAEAMADWNSRCVPPWGSGELRAKIESARKNGRPRAPKVSRTSHEMENTGDSNDDEDDDLPEGTATFQEMEETPQTEIRMTATNENAPRKFYPLTDVGNAERFADAYDEDLRYVPQWRAWLIWNKSHWVKDDTGTAARKRAYQLVRHRMPDDAKLIDDDATRQALLKHIAASQSASRLDSMVKIAETLMTIGPEEIDTHPYLLNVKNGTLDLAAGTLRPHKREDYLTKISPVVYDTNAVCPVWEKFIIRVMQNADGIDRPDMVDYLQRACGYSLTGDTSEQCIFIPNGLGRNGKTTMLNLLAYIAGDYAMAARSELLMKSANKSNHEGEANLFGKRVVVTSETNEGQSFDESTVKRLADKQKVRARHIYGREFEFMVTHKIWLDCNHLPSIKGDDLGIWRRIKRIPFEVQIPDAERDRHLETKLKAEGSGVLNWMLAGLAAYTRDGLKDPESVTAANREYRDDSDTFGIFLKECAQNNEAAEITKGDLFKVYIAWCKSNGMTYPLSQPAFTKKMKAKGYTEHRTDAARKWRGIELLPHVISELAIPTNELW